MTVTTIVFDCGCVMQTAGVRNGEGHERPAFRLERACDTHRASELAPETPAWSPKGLVVDDIGLEIVPDPVSDRPRIIPASTRQVAEDFERKLVTP